MTILNNDYNIGNKLKKISAYAVAFLCTFYVSYFLGIVGYLHPYYDSDLTGASVIFFICYYMFGFLIAIVVTDSGFLSMRFVNTSMFVGVSLFFIYLIPYSDHFKKSASDTAYHNLFKQMGISKDKNEEKHTNDITDKIYESYKNKDVSKLSEYEEKIDDVKSISKETFAQLIVNVKVIGNPVVTDFYNKILEDKRISIKEYRDITKLIVEQELKD